LLTAYELVQTMTSEIISYQKVKDNLTSSFHQIQIAISKRQLNVESKRNDISELIKRISELQVEINVRNLKIYVMGFSVVGAINVIMSF
jgi:hypothetical protein